MKFWVPPDHHGFRQFKRFLDGWSSTFECQESFVSMCKHQEIEGRLNKRLESSVPGALHIDIVFDTYDVVYYLMLDRVLSMCRPWYVCLWAPYILLKTISVDFTNKEDDPDWATEFGSFRFVFCDGVNVTGVNWIGGVEEDEPDWLTLLSLPHAETTCVTVGFGLQW